MVPEPGRVDKLLGTEAALVRALARVFPHVRAQVFAREPFATNITAVWFLPSMYPFMAFK